MSEANFNYIVGKDGQKKCFGCTYEDTCKTFLTHGKKGLKIPSREDVISKIITEKGKCSAVCAVACMGPCPVSFEKIAEKDCYSFTEEQRYKKAVEKAIISKEK